MTIARKQNPFTDTNKIISFLEGTGQDHRGRTFKDFLEADDTYLEGCHDFIQGVVPLHEESRFATTYPILTEETVEKAKQSETIKKNLILAKERMERFYGIGKYYDDKKIEDWFNKGPRNTANHNLLRVTRIIRSLRLLGLETEAQDFYETVKKSLIKFIDELMSNKMEFWRYDRGIDLKKLYDNTQVYWNKAANDDVWASLL